MSSIGGGNNDGSSIPKVVVSPQTPRSKSKSPAPSSKAGESSVPTQHTDSLTVPTEGRQSPPGAAMRRGVSFSQPGGSQAPRPGSPRDAMRNRSISTQEVRKVTSAQVKGSEYQAAYQLFAQEHVPNTPENRAIASKLWEVAKNHNEGLKNANVDDLQGNHLWGVAHTDDVDLKGPPEHPTMVSAVITEKRELAKTTENKQDQAALKNEAKLLTLEVMKKDDKTLLMGGLRLHRACDENQKPLPPDKDGKEVFHVTHSTNFLAPKGKASQLKGARYYANVIKLAGVQNDIKVTVPTLSDEQRAALNDRQKRSMDTCEHIALDVDTMMREP